MNRTLLICVILAVGLTGCATKRYTWNHYDSVLLQHYRSPQESEVFAESLKEIVQKSEEAGNVPPGIYAEYGYVLYEKGQYDDAIGFFRKEHDKWPESRVFMKNMISNAQNRQNSQSRKDAAHVQTKQ